MPLWLAPLAKFVGGALISKLIPKVAGKAITKIATSPAAMKFVDKAVEVLPSLAQKAPAAQAALKQIALTAPAKSKAIDVAFRAATRPDQSRQLLATIASPVRTGSVTAADRWRGLVRSGGNLMAQGAAFQAGATLANEAMAAPGRAKRKVTAWRKKRTDEAAVSGVARGEKAGRSRARRTPRSTTRSRARTRPRRKSLKAPSVKQLANRARFAEAARARARARVKVRRK